MNGLTPDKIPVLSFLADNFALFDEYFCSVPGPTIPNRFFALTGTAAGLTNTGFDCFIIFSVLVFFYDCIRSFLPQYSRSPFSTKDNL